MSTTSLLSLPYVFFFFRGEVPGYPLIFSSQRSRCRLLRTCSDTIPPIFIYTKNKFSLIPTKVMMRHRVKFRVEFRIKSKRKWTLERDQHHDERGTWQGQASGRRGTWKWTTVFRPRENRSQQNPGPVRSNRISDMVFNFLVHNWTLRKEKVRNWEWGTFAQILRIMPAINHVTKKGMHPIPFSKELCRIHITSITCNVFR